MIDYSIDKLSVDEKVGQLIVFGFNALNINDHVINLIKKYKAGNIILFARNVKNPKQLFELNQNLQKLAMEAIGIPLLITIDQEGGMVTRIKNEATFFPGAMTLSASKNVNNSYESGRLMGRELKALGINMNLAPSLDVNNNPYNPVIGVRSFSDDPNKVSEYGVANIVGMQESVIATAKHFPGHGDTRVDSHKDLPRIGKSLEDLKKTELVPFVAAIKNGVKAIMSSHINFPEITDNGLPTTLSRKCLTGLLRNKLGFEGLIITDCLEMKAIQTYYTTKEGALMAVKAGANLVCISNSEHLQIDAIDHIKEAITNGDISIEVINEGVKNVLKYKSENIEIDLNSNYEQVKGIIKNKKSKEFAYNVVEEAFALVKGTYVEANKRTLLISSEPLSTTVADGDSGEYSIIKSVKKQISWIDTFPVSVKLSEEEIEKLSKLATKYEQVVFCSYNANIYQNQLNLIRSLSELTELHVLAMRNPYDSLFFKEIRNLVLFYEYTPNSIKVLIEYLKGKITPKGVIPIKL